MPEELTGYPSIDKPWLKYYSEEAINAPLPEMTMYQYIWENNKDVLAQINQPVSGIRRQPFLVLHFLSSHLISLPVLAGF